MNPLKLFTIGALAAASLESQAAVIHTSLDSRFDASVTVETVADGSLKLTVDFNNAPGGPFGVDTLGFYTNMRLAYIQFPTIIEGNRINTSDPDKIFVETFADGVTENPRGRTYYGEVGLGRIDEQYFTPGETDVFFIEPINETHTFDADIWFAQPVRLYFQHEVINDPYYTHTIEATTVVSPAVPEPSTALFGAIAALGLIRRRR